MKKSLMKSSWKLQLRMLLVMAVLFFIVYVLVSLVAYFLGFGGSMYFFAGLSILIILAEYWFGPSIVKHSMRVRELTPEEAPYIHQMVEELAAEAGVPKPKVGISEVNIPNAFAYGRSSRSGHIALTRPIIGLLTRDELKAVIGHEMGHIKHNDMIVTTVVSIIPMICYYIALSFMFSGDNENNSGFIIGIIGYALYFVGQLLVLCISRIREYYADEASVAFGNKPSALASALYKLSFGAAKSNKNDLKEASTNRAFFVNDVNNGVADINSFKELDFDGDGSISEEELRRLNESKINIKTSEKLFEALSTHPNMLKRVKKLAELENQ